MFGGMGAIVCVTMVVFFLSARESAGRERRETIGRWWRNRQARRSGQSGEDTNQAEYSRLALDSEAAL